MGGYDPLLEPPEVVSRAAKVAKTLRSRTPAKLYSCDAILGCIGYTVHLSETGDEGRLHLTTHVKTIPAKAAGCTCLTILFTVPLTLSSSATTAPLAPSTVSCSCLKPSM